MRKLMIGLALTALAAAPAFADEVMKDGTMMMMTQDGHMVTKTPSGSELKMMQGAMMKNGAAMKAPVILMMHDGKVMMVNDMKLNDGKMLSDHMMRSGFID